MQKKDSLTLGVVTLLTSQANSPCLIEALVALVRSATWFDCWFFYRGKSTDLPDDDKIAIVDKIESCYEKLNTSISDFQRNMDEDKLLEDLYLIKKMIGDTTKFGDDLLERARGYSKQQTTK